MSIVEWTLAGTLLARAISHYKYAKRGEPSRIQISGGEISKFLLTFVFLYIWNAIWFTVIGINN